MICHYDNILNPFLKFHFNPSKSYGKNQFYINFQYVENVPKWGEQCEISAANVSAVGSGNPDPTRSTQLKPTENSQQDINTLESTIHHHQALYESMCQVRFWMQ